MRVQPYQGDQAQVPHHGDHVESQEQEEEGHAESCLVCQACEDELCHRRILGSHSFQYEFLCDREQDQ